MEKELIVELNEIRKELEMPMEDFIKIVALSIMHRKKSKANISDEMLYEIILGAMTDYDYVDYEQVDQVSSISAIKSIISSERKERRLSDSVLFDIIEEYLENIGEKREVKSPEDLVNKSVKSLGY